MSTTPQFLKDPQAVLDYAVDWATWLGSDTITSSAFTVGTGLTKDSQATTTTKATVWLSGGTDGTDYQVTNTITTAGGRTDERTITIMVRNR